LSVGAQSQASAPAAKEISKDEAKTLVKECGSRRFQTSAQVPVEGKVRRVRVQLCAADSETNAQWIAKLEKALAQIEAQPNLFASAKTQLAGELRAEIARVKSGQLIEMAGPPPSIAASSVPAARPSAPPIPARPTARTQKSPLADISALPPLPRAPAVGRTPAASVAAAARRPAPKLDVECATVGDDRSGRCGATIAPDERLVIRATERFNGPVTLRFRRVGTDVTAEVPFATTGVRAGQSARYSIPKDICAGKVRTNFEIELVTSNASSAQASGRLGPFTTRCAS
jgi:hypothetical protein